MSIDAKNPQDRAEQLLRITKRLSQLILEEREAFTGGGLDAASHDWAEKETLARAYRLEMAEIHQDPSRLAGIDSSMKQYLKTSVKALQTSLSEHAAALGAIKKLTEGLVRSVSKEMAKEQAPPAIYGSSGKAYATRSAQGMAVDARA